MENLFKNAGFILSDNQLALFEEYYKILVFYNEKFNITAITDKKDVYIKHFIDSLLGAEFINGDFLDVGSGGGFPSVPVKLFKPELKATLLEATGKKCEFLKEVIKTLKLDNVNVINGRAEELAHDNSFREKFDFVTARAVAAMPVLAEYCLPFVKTGGNFVAYKGDNDAEIKDSVSAVKILGGKIEKTVKFDLFGNNRNIVVVKKERATDNLYPRTNAKIKKKPL